MLGPRLWADWTGLLVPAYFGPGREADWIRLATAAATVPVIAIANVANGPGASRRDDYQRVITRVRENGGRVVGYVHTTYGRRPTAEVVDDIDRWSTLYPLDGIFVDEMTNDGTSPGLQYYRDLREHVRTLHPDWLVIGNPGTGTRESYLTTPTADLLVTFEHHTGYPAFAPDPWTRRHAAESFGHLCYGVSPAATMAQYLNLARPRGAGWIYVTDDALPNPWDRLPAYWEEEVTLVRQQNALEPVLLTVVSHTPSALSLRIDSIPGRHAVEGSADLLHWEQLYSAGAPGGRLEVTLTTAGTQRRFFRASR